MSKWDKAAVIALVYGEQFFWIESRAEATEKDARFI